MVRSTLAVILTRSKCWSLLVSKRSSIPESFTLQWEERNTFIKFNFTKLSIGRWQGKGWRKFRNTSKVRRYNYPVIMALVLGCLRIPDPYFESLYIHQIFQVCSFLNIFRNILETKIVGPRASLSANENLCRVSCYHQPPFNIQTSSCGQLFELTAIKIEVKGRFWNSCSFT